MENIEEVREYLIGQIIQYYIGICDREFEWLKSRKRELIRLTTKQLVEMYGDQRWSKGYSERGEIDTQED